MARIRNWAGKQAFPALKGQFRMYTRRGAVVVAAWPRKRGKKSTPEQRRWRDWFKEANRLAKIGDPDQMRLAVEYTRGTGLYPRDLLLMAMSRGIVDIIDGDGPPITMKEWRLEAVTWQGFIIQPTVNISIGVGVLVDVPWPVPTFQTLPFWNAGAPTLITVPTGVTKLELHAGVSVTGSTTARVLLVINQVGFQNRALVDINASPSQRCTVHTGPMIVAPGDQFRVQCFVGSSGVLLAASGLFFSGTILEAA